MNQNQLKILSFSKIMIQNDLIPDITQLICETFNTRYVSAFIIQKSYNEYKYFKEMLENGYFKLPCGDWTNGRQCICDICLNL